MSNDSTNLKIIFEIPWPVLDHATQLRGHNPLIWLKRVLEETRDAREQQRDPGDTEPSGFADLTSRQVAIATLVDKVIESLVDLVMFQAQEPVPSDVIPRPGDNIDPKTEIVGEIS